MIAATNTIQRALANLSGVLSKSVEVGFPDGVSDPHDQMLASILEYRGYPDQLPESSLPPSWRKFHETHPRSPYQGWAFMAKTQADIEIEGASDMKGIVVKALNEPAFDIDGALNRVGQKYEDAMKKKIAEILDPSVQESTVERRSGRAGSIASGAQPLVDTGDFVRAVTHRVIDKRALTV